MVLEAVPKPLERHSIRAEGNRDILIEYSDCKILARELALQRRRIKRPHEWELGLDNASARGSQPAGIDKNVVVCDLMLATYLFLLSVSAFSIIC